MCIYMCVSLERECAYVYIQICISRDKIYISIPLVEELWKKSSGR